MAYFTETKTVTSLSSLAARPFAAFWNLLIRMAEAHPRMKAVNALNAQTDEQLAARGTTRADEVHRIFANHLYQ